jgi:hypothetical protein
MSRPLDDREQEDLVAFLDGELSGEEARIIERKLSLDPTARAEAETLRRTWDLLDYLPRPEPSASFTEKTLTRLSSVRGESLLPPLAWRDRRWMSFGVVWMASMAVAMMSGFQGYRHMMAPAWAKSVPQVKQKLPKKLQDEINQLPSDERAKRLAELLEEQEALKKAWIQPPSPRRTWKPAPKYLEDFPPEVQQFVKNDLWDRLTEGEKRELKGAEGTWPLYGRTILKMDKRHPRLPALPSGPVVKGEQLTKILRESKSSDGARFTHDQLQQLGRLTGKWPDYAQEAKKLWITTHRQKVMPPLGASKLDEFPPAAHGYVEKELIPLLTPEVQNQLNRLEGRWPEYPNRLLDLARAHGKVIPGMSIPGPPELWKSVQSGIP